MYKERNEDTRKQFQEEMKDIPREGIVYIDESGIDHNEVKQKSWSPIGKPTL